MSSGVARCGVIGAAAGVASVGIELLAWWMLGAPNLIVVLGNAVVKAIPGHVFGYLIDRLQELGRPLLVLGILVAIGGAGAVVAVARERYRGLAFVIWAPALTIGLGTITLLLLVAVRAAFSPGQAAVIFGDWLLEAVCVELGLALRCADRRAASAAGGAPEEMNGGQKVLSRRKAVEGVGAGLALIVIGYALRDVLSVGAPKRLAEEGRAAPRLGARAAGVTPVREFYVVSKDLLGGPVMDGTHWSLRVGGRVPVVLSYRDLLDEPLTRRIETLECISNPVGGALMGTAVWEGVQLRRLLSRSRIPTGTNVVEFECADGYVETLDLSQALDPAVLVAWRMNGIPLPQEHGYPARLVVPGMYGLKSPKWLTAILPRRKKVRGFYEKQGWSSDPVVLTTSRIDYPTSLSELHKGDLVVVRGVAFAGSRGISKVEVSTDAGGTWARATTRRALSPEAWTLWTFHWVPRQRGQYLLMVRATDGHGRLQSTAYSTSFPSGSRGLDSVGAIVN